MSDRQIRELQRRFNAGDHAVVPELFRLLSRAGQQEIARNMVLRDMVDSGLWVPWPQWTPLRNWGQALQELNADFEAFQYDEPIVVPGVNLDLLKEEDVDTEYMTDGPYLVQYVEPQAHARAEEAGTSFGFWVDAPVITETKAADNVAKDVDGYLLTPDAVNWVRWS